jgi:hypothetical protein
MCPWFLGELEPDHRDHKHDDREGERDDEEEVVLEPIQQILFGLKM